MMWKAVLAVALAVIYGLLPYDVIPDLAILWGWLDDILILWLAWRYYKQVRNRMAARTTGPRARQGEETARGTGSDKNGTQPPPRSPGRKKSPYEILGVPVNATGAEIKQAYRRLANQYHPDKVNHLGEEFQALAETRFKEIQEAYQELKKSV